MMSDNEVERGRAKQDWFLEHGSIQAELMKLKKEAMRPKADDPAKKDTSVGPASSEAPHVNDMTDGPGERSGPGPQRPEPKDDRQPIDRAPDPPRVDRVDDVVKEVECGDRGDKAPKLPAGKIPTAPNLSQKIASVIQLENKLKRRKYEMERNSKAKGAAPDETEPTPKEAPDAIGPPSQPVGPEAVKVPSLEEEATLNPPSDMPGTNFTGTDQNAPLPIQDIPVQETAQVRTELDLDTGRGQKDDVPINVQDTTEQPPLQEIPDPLDGTDHGIGIEVQADPQPMAGQEVTIDGPVERSDPPQNISTAMDGADGGVKIVAEATKDTHRTADDRPQPERTGKEWLEMSRGPRKPAMREEKSGSPFGRILGFFKKKGK
ncbi:MAG: hypothetical protein MUC62_04425 [Candidatus Thermoplasmatota archaeon]|jgi:hypothetical protein|nr:hypothetical protein [Candidatus Thermoplasmatota archaeon]